MLQIARLTHAALASIACLTGVLTFFGHNWIETMFGLSPDSGNGSIEWVITILTAAIVLLCVVLAYCRWNPVRAAVEGEPHA